MSHHFLKDRRHVQHEDPRSPHVVDKAAHLDFPIASRTVFVDAVEKLDRSREVLLGGYVLVHDWDKRVGIFGIGSHSDLVAEPRCD